MGGHGIAVLSPGLPPVMALNVTAAGDTLLRWWFVDQGGRGGQRFQPLARNRLARDLAHPIGPCRDPSLRPLHASELVPGKVELVPRVVVSAQEERIIALFLHSLFILVGRSHCLLQRHDLLLERLALGFEPPLEVPNVRLTPFVTLEG